MNILFICIGNINRSRAAEAIINSLNIPNIHAFSRGLLPSNDGKPMSKEMLECLSPEEKKYVSSKAEDLTSADLEKADMVIIMDYYVKSLLEIRFYRGRWENKLYFYTQFFKNTEPYIPIKDPYHTKNYLQTYNDLKLYLPYLLQVVESSKC